MSVIIESLKNSLEFLNLIFDTIPTGILIVDRVLIFGLQFL